ncbi:MAG: ABC transporter ATP-binding protein [Vulcanimicrobiaceae bacterium]
MTANYARIENVTLKYGDKFVLRNCSLEIKERAITCLIGLSGAGKSTILRLLNGLRMPNEGKVFVKDIDLSTLRDRDLIDFRRKIGFSFQFAALCDSLTIAENVALPLREHTKMTTEEIERLVVETLDSVGLANISPRMPSELSGGMLKRAGFARAVVTSPELVLYDLDSIVLLAEYVAMLFEGAIIAYGTVDEIKASPNPIVQQFLQGSEVGPIPL